MKRNDLIIRLMILLGLAAIITAIVPSFLSATNLANVSRQAAMALPLALGMSLSMVMGGIDLSVGSVATLSSVVAAMMIVRGQPALGLLAGLTVGAALGAANGFLIGPLRLPAVVATYGMMRIAKGLALVLTGGLSVYGIENKVFLWFGQGFAGPFPASILSGVAILSVTALLLHNSTFGRKIYATGANRQAAFHSGIATNWITVVAYALSGMLAALAGFLFTAKLGAADATMGDPWVIDALAAAVIGGIAFSGGEGSVLGGALGVLILAVMNNGLTLAGVPAVWQSFAKGALIVVAVGIDIYLRRESVAGLLHRLMRRRPSKEVDSNL